MKDNYGKSVHQKAGFHPRFDDARAAPRPQMTRDDIDLLRAINELLSPERSSQLAPGASRGRFSPKSRAHWETMRKWQDIEEADRVNEMTAGTDDLHAAKGFAMPYSADTSYPRDLMVGNMERLMDEYGNYSAIQEDDNEDIYDVEDDENLRFHANLKRRR